MRVPAAIPARRLLSAAILLAAVALAAPGTASAWKACPAVRLPGMYRVQIRVEVAGCATARALYRELQARSTLPPGAEPRRTGVWGRSFTQGAYRCRLRTRAGRPGQYDLLCTGPQDRRLEFRRRYRGS